MLVDYEKLKGGGGFLRLLEFLPDGKTIQVRTYSPVSHAVRSPVTKGEKPLQDPKLEEFTGKSISFRVEPTYSQEQFDIVLL